MTEIDSPIRPISFQVLPAEDGDPTQTPTINHQHQQPPIESGKRKKRTSAELSSNFSMRPSYPAVIFDRLCFSVSKSQQQANFFADCLGRAKQIFSLGLASGPGAEKIDILKSINLNVPTGCIFGLLGPSSCGKTTLLRCLVGLLEPSAGSISLFCKETRDFGGTAATNEKDQLDSGARRRHRRGRRGGRQNLSEIPGANVGYMPQDLGLYEDFTIRQLLTMFGCYVGMESSLIRSRISFMTEFLDLPDADRVIVSLSGGQKRRVSFAIACLHMPPLIILDEPTVGVDPLLRQSIWKYLRRLADEENKTIIITTHYIEEAAQADQVALMRAGEILIQEAPKKIMQSHGCKTLEEAFLKICNNSKKESGRTEKGSSMVAGKLQLRPQLKFDWNDKIKCELNELMEKSRQVAAESQKEANQAAAECADSSNVTDSIVRRLQEKAQEKLAIFEYLQTKHAQLEVTEKLGSKFSGSFQNAVISELDGGRDFLGSSPVRLEPSDGLCVDGAQSSDPKAKKSSIRCLKRGKLVISSGAGGEHNGRASRLQLGANYDEPRAYPASNNPASKECSGVSGGGDGGGLRRSLRDSRERIRKNCGLIWALLYKNYRRNVNSLPLLAFQFMLPIIQMISFSLCIGGRPTQIGLGLVNHDQLISGYELAGAEPLILPASINSTSLPGEEAADAQPIDTELLSTRYLSHLDESMLSVRPYENLSAALGDVRRGKLWAAMEIGANFTRSISSRFDLDNFYQLEKETIRQSVIKLYPDRSNKVLDMICQRSLVNSYRQFLLEEFEHFKRLPVEVKEPIFDIKPNLISNSMDGYTESIAAGLLASLTYIMAAGLTCFIMVVERSAGILERTYTSGINPTAYLLAHAFFRSLVMMLQVGLVLFLTFYLLEQPLVGSIWLAYLMLMTLNLTGIAYGLLVSSLVSDQNGAALTIVSSLVVKITMSGILWPFEAIPRWLRAVCYVQPLTMPVQALKSITLKGSGLDDRSVYLGFVVSLTWLVVFLTVSARRFKFYQH